MSPNTRHEMIMGALQGAQAGAGSHPLTALLTPMASAAIGGRSGAALDTAREEANAKAIETIMAGRSGPMTAERLATLASFGGDELLAPGLQRLASTLMTDSLAPPKAKKSSGGGSGSSGTKTPDGLPKSAAMLGRYLDATEKVRGAVQDLVDYEGLSPDEAYERVRTDPMFSLEMQVMDLYQAPKAPDPAPAPDPEAPPPPESVPEERPKRGWFSERTSERAPTESQTVGSSVRKAEDVPPPPPGFTQGF